MKHILRRFLCLGLLIFAAGNPLRAGTLTFTNEADFLAAVAAAGLTNTHLNDLLEFNDFGPAVTPAPAGDFYGGPNFAYVLTTSLTNVWALPSAKPATGDSRYAPGGAASVAELGDFFHVIFVRSNVFAFGARVFDNDYDTGSVVNGNVNVILSDGTTIPIKSSAAGPIPFAGFLTQPPVPLRAVTLTSSHLAGVDHIYVAGAVAQTPTVKLSVPRRLANGTVQLALSGATGWKAEFQVSTNLTGWSKLVEMPIFSEPTTVTDPGATNAPRRFYRAIVK